jgi:translation initiation factor 2 subunit 1
MFYKKKGKPENGEIVICTVKKISFHSVFVTIEDYKYVEGMIHISEVSTGRIRNLRDYVKEGKRIVCKVLHINQRTGNIDLSLRRVGKNSMIEKLNDSKQEEKAEKLLEMVAGELKLKLPDMYKAFGFKVMEEYESMYGFFQDVVSNGEKVMKEIGVPVNILKPLYVHITDKIKPEETHLGGILEIESYEENGVDTIKKILTNIEKKGGKVTYLGAPKYKIEFTSLDQKEATTGLNTSIEESLAAIEKKGKGEFHKNA